MPAGKIFVCYRREDSAGHAGRLYDRLNQRFAGRVFMDVASIGVGTRWAEVIEETLGSCTVAIILIGKRWLEPGQGGVRRIDQPEDPTRAEIATALRLNLKIVPLLVSGAAVPERGELPADVAAIAEWQALRVDDDDFDHDATRLIRALEHQLGDHEAQRHPAAASLTPEEVPRIVADAESAIDQPKGGFRRRGFFGLSLGSLRVWVTIGVAAVAIVMVQVAGLLPGSPSPMSPVASSPVEAGSGAGDPATPPRPTSPEGSPRAPQDTSRVGSGASAPVPSQPPDAARPDRAERPNPPSPAATSPPSVAGDYALVSYREGGNLLQVTGAMRLTEIQPGRYQFETFVTNLLLGASFQYRGVFMGSGTTWTLTTMQTNDPNALVATPILTYVKFDGTTMAVANDYGQSAVWRKQ